MSDRVFLLLTWPGLPLLFAAVAMSVPALWLRRRDDRDRVAYWKHVNARAAEARCVQRVKENW